MRRQLLPRGNSTEALCDAEDRKLRAHAEAWARSFTRSPRGRASCKGSLVQTVAAWEGRP